MKFNIIQVAATVALLATSVSAAVVHEREVAHITPADADQIAERIHFDKEKREVKHEVLENPEDVAKRIHFKRQEITEILKSNPLEKRKGGGGGGKGGGGGGGGGGKSTGGGGKSSGGGKSVSKSHRGNSYGYRTYGGYYGGGASVPYKSGGSSPLKKLVPFLLPLAAIALIFPGLWLYAVYQYKYETLYNYYNETLGRNISIPVQCLCMQYSDCACDDTGDTAYLHEIVALRQSNTTQFSMVDGQWTLIINGTVENGTGPAAGDEISGAGQVDIVGYIWMVGVACLMAWSL